MIFNETKLHGSVDFPIELYHVDKTHPRYEMVHHWHKNIEIVRVLSGELLCSLNNREFTAHAGELVFINSEIVHGAIPQNDCLYECVVYDPELVPALSYNGDSFAESLAGRRVLINEEIDRSEKELYSCVNMLFDALKNDSQDTRYTTIGMLCSMYGIIIRNKLYTKADSISDKPDAPIMKLKNVLRFIRNSYNTDITLEDMANVAGMSRKYFCTFFKQFTHQTPFDYLITYRIERATSFLITTDRDITDIAYSCGFNDLSYFIKTFKSIKGMSPGMFRKSRYAKSVQFQKEI